MQLVSVVLLCCVLFWFWVVELGGIWLVYLPLCFACTVFLVCLYLHLALPCKGILVFVRLFLLFCYVLFYFGLVWFGLFCLFTGLWTRWVVKGVPTHFVLLVLCFLVRLFKKLTHVTILYFPTRALLFGLLVNPTVLLNGFAHLFIHQPDASNHLLIVEFLFI